MRKRHDLFKVGEGPNRCSAPYCKGGPPFWFALTTTITAQGSKQLRKIFCKTHAQAFAEAHGIIEVEQAPHILDVLNKRDQESGAIRADALMSLAAFWTLAMGFVLACFFAAFAGCSKEDPLRIRAEGSVEVKAKEEPTDSKPRWRSYRALWDVAGTLLVIQDRETGREFLVFYNDCGMVQLRDSEGSHPGGIIISNAPAQ